MSKAGEILASTNPSHSQILILLLGTNFNVLFLPFSDVAYAVECQATDFQYGETILLSLQ